MGAFFHENTLVSEAYIFTMELFINTVFLYMKQEGSMFILSYWVFRYDHHKKIIWLFSLTLASIWQG